MKNLLAFGALLLAAPLVSQEPLLGPEPQSSQGQIIWFTLNETPDQVLAALGRPAVVAEFAGDFLSWQYQVGDIDRHEFSHQVVFRKSSRALVSITRNYDPERTVDALFPEAQTTVHHFTNGGKPEFSIRLRRLPGNVLLMAMGTSRPGQRTAQLVLIRQSELRHFHPWLFDQLQPATGP